MQKPENAYVERALKCSHFPLSFSLTVVNQNIYLDGNVMPFIIFFLHRICHTADVELDVYILSYKHFALCHSISLTKIENIKQNVSPKTTRNLIVRIQSFGKQGVVKYSVNFHWNI